MPLSFRFLLQLWYHSSTIFRISFNNFTSVSRIGLKTGSRRLTKVHQGYDTLGVSIVCLVVIQYALNR